MCFAHLFPAGHIAVFQRHSEVLPKRNYLVQRSELYGKLSAAALLYAAKICGACSVGEDKAVRTCKLDKYSVHIRRADIFYGNCAGVFGVRLKLLFGKREIRYYNRIGFLRRGQL